MDFSGWEKLSLVDFDDNITTTLFAAGCAFRCPFCHNGDLVLHPEKAPKIPWDEIMSYLRKRVGVIDAVCVSGGEPTLMPDLLDKLREIKSLGYKVKLDSNGSNPEVLKKAVALHLVDYIAMDIKNSKAEYAKTSGLAHLDLSPIEESVRFIMSSGIDYEFRTTIIDEFHDEGSMKDIGTWIKGAKRYYLQRYIDNENCIKRGLHMVEKDKAEGFIKILSPFIKEVALRSYE